jgi:hypothetical protein
MSEKRHFSYYTGARWGSLVLSLVLIAVISLWLARGLRETEERTEKLLLEMTIRRMHMGMQIAIGEAMMRGRDKEIVSWAGSNPVRWLDGDLRAYAGNCAWDKELAPGGWCFDSLRGELQYRPRNIGHLRLKNGQPVSLLRWKVVALNATAEGGLVGLRVENVTPYEWFAE